MSVILLAHYKQNNVSEGGTRNNYHFNKQSKIEEKNHKKALMEDGLYIIMKLIYLQYVVSFY